MYVKITCHSIITHYILTKRVMNNVTSINVNTIQNIVKVIKSLLNVSLCRCKLLSCLPYRKALSADQAFLRQLTDAGEGDGTIMDHSGFAETEGLSRTAAKQRGKEEP